VTRQLALPLPPRATQALAELLEDDSNAEALAWLRRPAAWPAGRLALFGPAATGKSHMLRGLADELGWPVRHGPGLRGLPPLASAGGIAVDDADCLAEEASLLHLLNAAAERGQQVLLAGREPPGRWAVALPDLRSRLRAITAVRLHPPGDALLEALLRRDFARRQVRVDPGVQDWVLARLPREAAAVAEAAARLDRAALAAGGPITRALARQILPDMPGFGAGFDDESVASPAHGCPAGPALL